MDQIGDHKCFCTGKVIYHKHFWMVGEIFESIHCNIGLKETLEHSDECFRRAKIKSHNVGTLDSKASLAWRKDGLFILFNLGILASALEIAARSHSKGSKKTQNRFFCRLM